MGVRHHDEKCSSITMERNLRCAFELGCGGEFADFSGIVHYRFQKREKWETFVEKQRTRRCESDKGKKQEILRKIDMMHANALGFSIDDMISLPNAQSILFNPECTSTNPSVNRRKSLLKAVSLKREFSRDAVISSGRNVRHTLDGAAVNPRKSLLKAVSPRRREMRAFDNEVKSSLNCYDVDSLKTDVEYIFDGSESTAQVEDISLSSSCTKVNFAEKLVTSVHERPYTMASERASLFYTKAEYRDFKRDFYRMHQRGSKSVHFSDSPVSRVWTLPAHDNKDEMFYTEAEIRNFLKEFIESRTTDLQLSESERSSLEN